MLFKDLPIWDHFFLPHQDDVCLKTGPSTAVDASCARGFCFTVRPEEVCDLAIRKDAAGSRAIDADRVAS
jgi:hypothetical protein